MNFRKAQAVLPAKPVSQPMRELDEGEQLRSVPKFDRAPLDRAFFPNAAVARPHIPAPRQFSLEWTQEKVCFNMAQFVRQTALERASPRGTQALVDSDEIAAGSSRIAEQVFFAAPIDGQWQAAEARK
jgi:hypothetical protein